MNDNKFLDDFVSCFQHKHMIIFDDKYLVIYLHKMWLTAT